VIDIECLLCDSNDSQVLIEENGYQGRKCAGCGLIYVSPRPAVDEIHDLYGHDEAKVTAESHITSAFPKRLYARHHLNLIQRYQSSGKLLEIGAGAGYFLDEARKRGFDCHGIEFNPIQARYITDHLFIDCEQTALGESSYMDEKFDLIYHCDVISHFYNPIEELGLMNHVLNMGGYMVFETGNIGDMDDEYLQYITQFQYPDHLFFFGVKNLENLLEKTGFELVRLHRFSLMPQLRLSRAISLLKERVIGKLVRPSTGSKEVQGGHGAAMEKKQRSSRGFLRSLKTFRINAMEYLYFQLRYNLGKLWVKSAQAQTLILVARKTADLPS
jgi:hypothetical protein